MTIVSRGQLLVQTLGAYVKVVTLQIVVVSLVAVGLRVAAGGADPTTLVLEGFAAGFFANFFVTIITAPGWLAHAVVLGVFSYVRRSGGPVPSLRGEVALGAALGAVLHPASLYALDPKKLAWESWPIAMLGGILGGILGALAGALVGRAARLRHPPAPLAAAPAVDPPA